MKTCPNCGYCPHCGRSAQPAYPLYPLPYQPWPVHPSPWWGINTPHPWEVPMSTGTVTIGSTTGIIGDVTYTTVRQ